ncbi:aldehyde dehydrogenase family protein [Streptomyces broussonetiae]|uniref:aldehyde dehydrogenase family protein n=1 Tax=Streptomyces broussonetiae TaxID=2686304 RepID=UPI0035E308E6
MAESIRDRFVDAFVARTKRLKIGPAYDYSIDVGSLTTSSQLVTVTAHVDDAVAKGATVLAGGTRAAAARPRVARANATPTFVGQAVRGHATRTVPPWLHHTTRAPKEDESRHRPGRVRTRHGRTLWRPACLQTGRAPGGRWRTGGSGGAVRAGVGCRSDVHRGGAS